MKYGPVAQSGERPRWPQWATGALPESVMPASRSCLHESPGTASVPKSGFWSKRQQTAAAAASARWDAEVRMRSPHLACHRGERKDSFVLLAVFQIPRTGESVGRGGPPVCQEKTGAGVRALGLGCSPNRIRPTLARLHSAAATALANGMHSSPTTAAPCVQAA